MLCEKCQEQTIYGTAQRIIMDIARERGFTISDIKSPRREYKLVRARFEIMAALKASGLSFPQVGRLLNRDHSTVMHGVRKHYEMAGAAK